MTGDCVINSPCLLTASYVGLRSNATNTSDSHVTLSVTLWCRHLSLASCACFRGKIAVCGRACHCAGRLRTRRYSNATCVWFSRASRWRASSVFTLSFTFQTVAVVRLGLSLLSPRSVSSSAPISNQ